MDSPWIPDQVSMRGFTHSAQTPIHKNVCILKIQTASVPKQHTHESRATSDETPFFEMFRKSFLVPIATKYAEPCHSWSVLYRPLNIFPGVHHSMQVVPYTMRRNFHLRDFIDQNTVRRSSDLQHVHTRRVQSLQIRLNNSALFHS